MKSHFSRGAEICVQIMFAVSVARVIVEFTIRLKLIPNCFNLLGKREDEHETIMNISQPSFPAFHALIRKRACGENGRELPLAGELRLIPS